MARWVLVDIDNVPGSGTTQIVGIYESEEAARQAFEGFRRTTRDKSPFRLVDRLIYDFAERQVALFVEKEPKNG